MPEGDTLARIAVALRPVPRGPGRHGRPRPPARAAGLADRRPEDRCRRRRGQEPAHQVRRRARAADPPRAARLVASLPAGRDVAPPAVPRRARARGAGRRRRLLRRAGGRAVRAPRGGRPPDDLDARAGPARRRLRPGRGRPPPARQVARHSRDRRGDPRPAGGGRRRQRVQERGPVHREGRPVRAGEALDDETLERIVDKVARAAPGQCQVRGARRSHDDGRPEDRQAPRAVAALGLRPRRPAVPPLRDADRARTPRARSCRARRTGARAECQAPAADKQAAAKRPGRRRGAKRATAKRSAQRRRARRDRVQAALLVDALEAWAAAVDEREAGARDEVAHRGRHEHLARPRGRRDARPVWTAIPRMSPPGAARSRPCGSGPDSRPSRGPPRRSQSPPGSRAPGRRTRPGSHRRRVDLAASKARQLGANGGVVALQQVAPAPVTQLRRQLGRADDVGEEDRGQDAVGLLGLARAGDELPDLGQGAIGLEPGQVVPAWHLDVSRTRECSASQRAFSTWQTRSPVAWMIRVGTWIDGTTSRTSMSKAIRANASQPAGVAEFRWTFCHHASMAGSRDRSRSTGRASAAIPWPPGSGILATVASNCSTVDSPHGQSSSVRSRTSPPWRMSARVRSGCAAAKRMPAARPRTRP